MTSITQHEFTETDVYQDLVESISEDPYINSKFKILKDLSSKKKGSLFEKLYTEFKLSQGIAVTKASNSDHDRIVAGKKVEIKGSFLWGESNVFRWQQIRTSQDYEIIVFIAIYPDRIEFYQADKDTVKANLEVQDSSGDWIHNQHGGKSTNSGCFFIDGLPEDFSWFEKECIGN